MHWRKKLSREVSLKLNFVAYFFPSKFNQRDYRRSAICQSFKSFYPFFSEKRRVVFEITFIDSEISRIFFSFFYIICKTNDRFKKIYWQKMSILTSSIQRYL